MTFAKYPVTGAGAGTVTGPGSSTDNAVVLWDGTTGAAIKNSSILSSDIVLTSGNQTIVGTKTFSSGVVISATTNQLVLGTTNTVTITSPAPAASRVHTIPDVADSSFVMTNGAFTINGGLTFSGLTTFNAAATFGSILRANADIYLNPSANHTQITAPNSGGTKLYTIPNVGATANFVMTEGTQTINGAKTFTNVTLPATVNYTSAGSIVKSGVGALTLTNASAAGLTFSGTGTVTAPTGTYTLAGLSLSNVFTVAQTISATTNQIVLGTTNTTTINSSAPAASRTYNIIDAGGAADFVMTAATQTIGGSKTFSSAVTINPASNQIVLSSGINQLTLNSSTSAAARTYSFPDVGTTGTVAMLEGAQTFSALKTFSSGLAVTGGTGASQRLTVSSTTWTIGNGPTITEAGAATFATSVTTPSIVGGSSVSQVLTIKSTSGIGTSDRIDFVVGNNGAVTGLSIGTAGAVTLGPTSGTANTNTVYGFTQFTTTARASSDFAPIQAVRASSNTGPHIQMTREGILSWGFGVNTSNSLEIGVPSSSSAYSLIAATITNAGAVTLTQIHNRTDGNINSGRYTPTVTAGTSGGTNISANGTPASSIYCRVGNVVTVTARVVGVSTTAGAPTLSVMRISIPIASNFTADTDLSGTGTYIRGTATLNGNPIFVRASVAGDDAELVWNSSSTAASDFNVTFQYEVK